MKYKISLLIYIFCIWFLSGSIAQINVDRKVYREFLKEHPFSKRPRMTKTELKKIPKKDRPDLAWEQNYLMTLDPALGYPPYERLLTAYKYTDSLRNALFPRRSAIPGVVWEERGPDNIGGRTRALMFDPNDVTYKKVWAGGVTGGLWYNTDISTANSKWIKVNDFWDNISITCICYDPNNTNIFYIGTGEGFSAGSSSSTRGAGVWKTTNGGVSWTQLSATSSYYYVNDIMVRNESGTSALYVAVDAKYDNGKWHGTPGLFRSTDGGTTFSQVTPNISGYPYAPADIEIGVDNRIYIGTQKNPFGKGGGTILYSDNGTSWTTVSKFSGISGVDRVELACAPSNANYIYAVYEVSGKVGGVAYSKNKGANWTYVNKPNDADPGIDSSDFSNNQAWYDLILAVDPNDYRTVIAGGIDLHMTTDSGSTWTQLSHWWGGYGFPYVHADHHAIVYQPGSSSIIINGNDGGVAYSTNVNALSPAFSDRNNGYNVTQFYSCALNPTAGSNNFIGGTQDNGSLKFTTSGINSVTAVTGGDGAYCFIDQDNPNYQISSYVYNSYYLTTNNWSSYSQISSNSQTGLFINAADYDDRENILFSSRTTNSLQRISGITSSPATPDTIGVALGAMASAIKVSPYSTAGTSTIFVGTRDGELYKITNAHSNSPVLNKITGTTFPAGNISCIDLGKSENEILVSFSNYGVTSLFESTDGGVNWNAREGNLPDMPVRWCMYYPENTSYVLLATEIGVWSTTDVKVTSPDWAPTNGGLANVRTDMLQYRSSDKKVIAATHGRGMFSFYFSTLSSVTADFTADTVCFGDSTTLIDLSTASVSIDSVMWDLDSNGVFDNGSGDTLNFKFITSGTFWVGVKAFIGGATDSVYKQIVVNESPAVDFNFSPLQACISDTVRFTNNTSVNSSVITGYLWDFGDSDTSSLKNPWHIYAADNVYSVNLKAVLANGCSDSLLKNFTVSSVSTADFLVNDTAQCLKGNAFEFYNMSSACAGILSVNWDLDEDGLFDDASGDTVQFTFGNADTFDVGLKIITVSDTDSVYTQVYVYDMPVADFSINSATQPLSSNNFILTNTSSYQGNITPAGMAYNWNFGDGNSASAIDTAHTYTAFGNYNIRLVVTSPEGCIDTSTKQVTVTVPGIVTDFISDSVCSGDTVTLVNNEISQDPVVGYAWAFDQDSIFDDAIGDTIVDYYNAVPGTYYIGFKAWTATDTDLVFKAVAIHPLPAAGFTVNSVSQPLNVNDFVFTNSSTISSGTLNYIWDFDDGNGSTTKDPTHIYASIGNYNTLLTVVSDFGCTDTVSMLLNVYQSVNVSLTADFSAVDACAGEAVQFVNSSTISGDTIINYHWDYGDGTDAIVKTDHEHVYNVAGTYTVQLVAISKLGFTDTTYQSVEVFTKPNINFIFDGDTIFFEGASLNVSVSGIYDSIIWSTGALAQEITINETGIYSVRVVDNNNCSDESSFEVLVKEVGLWQATEVFSPNGDGVNDLWIIPDIDAYAPVQVTIFNRWGDKIYESNDYKNDWDAKYDGHYLPEGTYYYVAKTQADRIYKGSISILR